MTGTVAQLAPLLILAGVALVVAAVVTALLRATIGKRAETRNRARSIRWRIRLHLRPGTGYASAAELLIRWSRTRAVFHGRRARPGLSFRARLTSPATDYAVRLGRAQWGRKVYARLEDQVLILAPPRIGKTGILADRILSHPGAVLCTSTRADLFESTAAGRALRGLLAVFNPQGVGGILSTFAWNIVAGCEDPAIAARRADSLTGAVGSTGQQAGDMAFWQSKASLALAAFLHAAALIPGATIVDVFGWCNRHRDEDAAQVLATHPLASRPLLSTLAEILRDARYADSVRMTMSKALAWVAIPSIAAAVTPADGEGFDVADFIAANGTLYMIATDAENSPIAPLFRAFCAYVHYEAGMVGSRSPARRLDPPLLMALDEVTQICPVPLPEWLSDSAGKGILICAVCHGTGQLESRWGQYGAATIWSTAGTKIMLGGISDSDTLEYVSRLCGTIELSDGDRYESVRVLPPEVLRQLPDWRALVLRMNLSPTVVKVRPVWRRLSRRFGGVLEPSIPLLRAYVSNPLGYQPATAVAADDVPVIGPAPSAEHASAVLADELAARRLAAAPPPRPGRPPEWVRGGDGD